MKALGLSLTAALALILFGTTGRVHAQGMTPPISPYMQLMRPGINPGLNYMTMVLPEMELYNAANQLQAGQAGLGQAMATGMGSFPQTTGHPAMYGPNYLQYYRFGRGGMGMGGMGMGGMGMGGMGMGGMMGGMGMGGMGMGGMMGGMGMGGMGMGGMMGGMGMGGMGMGGMGMGGMMR